MSVAEVFYTDPWRERRSRLHIVTEGETSAHYRRKVAMRADLQSRRHATARACATLGCVAAVFATVTTTMVWAFLAIPNVPIP